MVSTLQNAEKEEKGRTICRVTQHYIIAAQTGRDSASAYRCRQLGCRGEQEWYSSTSLHYASLTRQIEAVHILANAGAELVARNKYERTAMDEALQAGRRDGADYLMKEE